ncbi:TIR domain-containing protein [Spirosoma oryzae]|uniref:TIR domain-containing protein n=1 Tax=Spirosoma oryzae TaxID=1469603 RepID=A0A2T0RIX3_9BACT|nr:toll/interleukin-1 receptor domain-containing protein [Spirosoma oryzae]PRY21125.1 TIR domain-containing protein [Spirosoma oryzae]
MAHNFFISHYSKDFNVAEIIANLLQKITLNQIQPWFSSDKRESGGLMPGDIWFSQIIEKISRSKAVVVLLTPNSINRPWLYYESGIAQALPECELIPICIGIKGNDVPAPLNVYQYYQVSDLESLRNFTAKLVSKFGIPFDEDMTKGILERVISNLSEITFEPQKNEKQPGIEEILNEVKNHFDNRFIELISNNNISRTNSAKRLLMYDVSINIKFNTGTKTHVLSVSEDSTFGDITDNIFFLLERRVAPFTYLSEWILVEDSTNIHIVIREVADQIPAKNIFKINNSYSVKFLANPYIATDSQIRLDERR